jgi:hypothetical protein
MNKLEIEQLKEYPLGNDDINALFKSLNIQPTNIFTTKERIYEIFPKFTYKNLKGLSKDSIKQEAVNILSNPAAIATAVSTVGGVVGTVFPKSTGTPESTDATAKRIAPTPPNP